MAGPAAVKCYYSSGNAETLTRACMYNPPAHLTSLHINGHIICMLCNSVRCLGENVLYVCIQCFDTFWVSDIYITLARTRPPFAFRAVSNRGPLSGTVLTVMLDHFFKMEDLQVRWKSALNSALQNFKQLLHVFFRCGEDHGRVWLYTCVNETTEELVYWCVWGHCHHPGIWEQHQRVKEDLYIKSLLLVLNTCKLNVGCGQRCDGCTW